MTATISEIPIYQRILDLGIAHLHAFDGDQRHTKRMKENYNAKATVYPDFLFDGSIQNVYLAHPKSGMTSLLKPKPEALQFFNGFNRIGAVKKIESIQTAKIDDLEKLPHIDFAKLDIQGAELTVLKNGSKKLSNCLAIQLEVSFICLYEQQPSFGEMDVWMRSQGYVPHRFIHTKKWSISPTVFNHDWRKPGNQLLEADLVYIRDPLTLHLLTDIQLKKMALISHYCFESIDLCGFIFLELEKRKTIPKGSYETYILNSKILSRKY